MRSAAGGLDVELVVVDDSESRGPSWARNEGLRRATGNVVFFIDADDVVKPEFFSRLLDALESSGADFILSSYAYAPLKRDYNLSGNAAIREAMLPAFFGYSFDDVRRWNAGGDLGALREQGSANRSVFRREFLDRHGIRFDERLLFYEDAPFMAECACRAERVASISDILYDYTPGDGGQLSSSHSPDMYAEYKFAALENRKAIASRVGGDVMRHFEASAVFSCIELFKAGRDWCRYAADPFVAASLRAFPLSLRHPLAAVAVSALRLLVAKGES